MGTTWTRLGGLTALAMVGLGAQPGHPSDLKGDPVSATATAAQAANLSPLEFELFEHYQIVARGAIGPLGRLKFLIDTGSNPSVVDRRVAKKLSGSVQGSESVAFGQRSQILTTVVPDIRLGPIRVQALTIGVGDLSFLHGVDAIVGLDVLSRASFSIDYQERRLLFGPMPARQPSVRLEATPPFLTIQIVLAGQQFRLLVDTGSRRLVLFERRVHDRLPSLPAHGALLLYHMSGTSRLNRVLLPHLDAGGWTMDRVEGFMSDAPLDGYPAGIDGVLGLRVLASKRADFDFERSRLAFD
jgi:predicted aspartyl protease